MSGKIRAKVEGSAIVQPAADIGQRDMRAAFAADEGKRGIEVVNGLYGPQDAGTDLPVVDAGGIYGGCAGACSRITQDGGTTWEGLLCEENDAGWAVRKDGCDAGAKVAVEEIGAGAKAYFQPMFARNAALHKRATVTPEGGQPETRTVLVVSRNAFGSLPLAVGGAWRRIYDPRDPGCATNCSTLFICASSRGAEDLVVGSGWATVHVDPNVRRNLGYSYGPPAEICGSFDGTIPGVACTGNGVVRDLAVCGSEAEYLLNPWAVSWTDDGPEARRDADAQGCRTGTTPLLYLNVDGDRNELFVPAADSGIQADPWRYYAKESTVASLFCVVSVSAVCSAMDPGDAADWMAGVLGGRTYADGALPVPSQQTGPYRAGVYYASDGRIAAVVTHGRDLFTCNHEAGVVATCCTARSYLESAEGAFGQFADPDMERYCVAGTGDTALRVQDAACAPEALQLRAGYAEGVYRAERTFRWSVLAENDGGSGVSASGRLVALPTGAFDLSGLQQNLTLVRESDNCTCSPVRVTSDAIVVSGAFVWEDPAIPAHGFAASTISATVDLASLSLGCESMIDYSIPYTPPTFYRALPA